MEARTLAIARGEHKPMMCESAVWTSSMEGFSKVLSQRNHEFPLLIAQERPQSLTDLAALSGRKKPNLSRTLNTMERYGPVELTRCRQGAVMPRAVHDHNRLDLDLMQSTRFSCPVGFVLGIATFIAVFLRRAAHVEWWIAILGGAGFDLILVILPNRLTLRCPTGLLQDFVVPT